MNYIRYRYLEKSGIVRNTNMNATFDLSTCSWSLTIINNLVEDNHPRDEEGNLCVHSTWFNMACPSSTIAPFINPI